MVKHVQNSCQVLVELYIWCAWHGHQEWKFPIQFYPHREGRTARVTFTQDTKTMNSWEMSVLLGSELWEMEFFFEINSFYLEASLAWFKLPLPIKQVHSEIKVLLSNYSSLLPHMANSVHPLAYIWVLPVYTALLKKRLRCSPSQMAVKLDKNMITEHLKKCGKFLFSRLSLKRNWHAKNLKFLGAC